MKGTKAHILRLGNIMPRLSDGKFQENIDENAFINRIKTFIKLKVLPDNISKINLEFTPVDSAATAILKVMYYSKENNIIYHIFIMNLQFFKTFFLFFEIYFFFNNNFGSNVP